MDETTPITMAELGLDGSLKKAITQLYAWQYESEASFFTAQLYSLMMKADPGNMTRLALAFPAEAEALCLWKATAGDKLRDMFESWMGPLAADRPPFVGQEEPW